MTCDTEKPLKVRPEGLFSFLLAVGAGLRSFNPAP